jgi:Putative beta-barrel porin-2, OmpL-like. bbp2
VAIGDRRRERRARSPTKEVCVMKGDSAGSRVRAVVAGAFLSTAIVAPAAAQQSPPAAASTENPVLTFFKNTELSGFVDTYYSYNFNTPAKPCTTVGGVAIFNCLHNFDVAHNSFSLNLAELALEKKPTADSRGGFRIDLDYGSAAGIVAGAEPGGTSLYQNIQQAYGSYLAPTGKGSLQFDFGKFVTMMGNEVIETKDNWNYSRGLLFALAIPYYHMGMRVVYSPNDKVTLQGHLVNGWNNVVDNNGGKSLGGSITYKPAASVTVIENYMGGPEQNLNNSDWRHTSDTIVSYTVNPQTSLALNYDYGHDTIGGASTIWQGIAAYLKYQPNTWLAVTPRYEYYKDRDGFTTGTAQNLQDFTLTLELKHKDGFLTRIEYRGDFSNAEYFIKNTTDIVKNQNEFTIGWVIAFSSKSP